MKKFLLCFCLCLMFLLGFAPAGGYYMDLATSQLGSIRVYMGNYRSGVFSLDENSLPVNMTTGSVTAYTLTDSGEREYQISFYPFGEGVVYRRYGVSSQWSDLTITGIDLDTSSIQFMGVDIPDSDWILYLFVFLIGCLLVVVWSKKG